MLEAGDCIVGFFARCPLLMRDSMSPRGSLMVMRLSPLPARLDHAGYLAGGREVAERDPGQLELAVIAARPAREQTAVVQAHGGRVARQLGKLEALREALFRRQRAVLSDRLEARALGRKALYQLGAMQ